jgi:hypothetical protein
LSGFRAWACVCRPLRGADHFDAALGVVGDVRFDAIDAGTRGLPVARVADRGSRERRHRGMDADRGGCDGAVRCCDDRQRAVPARAGRRRLRDQRSGERRIDVIGNDNYVHPNFHNLGCITLNLTGTNMAVPLVFNPRVTLPVAAIVALFNFARTAWHAKELYTSGVYNDIDSSGRNLVFFGTVGCFIVLIVTVYGVLRFEINRRKMEKTFQELDSEFGVWVARKMWLVSLYVSCICIVASFAFADLVNVNTRL